MKKLTQEQIDQLFTFTKKHLVEHYDVQVELVDHLANAIEAEWEINPNISFTEALEKEYKSFGIFGFSGLVEQKQGALQNHYWKIIKNEMISFFTLPKIILSTFLFYILFEYFSNPTELILKYNYIFQLILMITSLFMFFYLKKKNKTDKKWLIQSTANYLFSLPFSLFAFLNIGGMDNMISLSLFKIILNTITTELFLLFLLILYFKIVPIINKEILLTSKRFQNI